MAAEDIFLKLTGITGESQDHKHKGEINVISWSWGATQPGSMHVATGGGVGKVNVRDMSIKKRVDTSTPALWQAMCVGKHIDTATLTVRKAGENPLEFFVITLSSVLVTGQDTGGGSGDLPMTETVTLNFRTFDIKYVEQRPDGGAGLSTEFAFDIALNAPPESAGVVPAQRGARL
jgi:type VI secretion system secreted protein Hcp